MSFGTSAEVRSYLIQALQLDLVGPTPHDEAHAEEILPQSPSKWYLTGFLVPYEAEITQRSDGTSDEGIDEVSGVSAGDDENTPEGSSARKALFPSSMGLSFLVPPHATQLDVDIHWGDYFPLPLAPTEIQAETNLQTLTSGPWQRKPGQAHLPISLQLNGGPTQMSLLPDTKPSEQMSLPLQQDINKQNANKQSINKRIPVPNGGGLQIVLSIRPTQCHSHLPEGTRSISLFLVNYRPAAADAERDVAYVFQPSLSIHCADSFVPRPDMRGQGIDDEDEKIADLQYRNDYEYAVGHDVSAVATLSSGTCQTICTTWIPQADVEKVVAAEVENVELDMEALAAAPDAAAVRSMVEPMVTAYTAWIAQQQAKAPTIPQQRADTSVDLLHRAGITNQRIADGLSALDDPDVLEAFRIANRAIATAIRQRLSHNSDKTPEEFKPPKWRPFQLAFLLMNIRGIINPEHPDREKVDLLFFPTGGGKTEAYLGLAAFTLVLRRLRNPGLRSAGVSVLMRYTLRLLTLDQLGRASTLICALELERQKNPEKLGNHPFEIGLWVGQSATPNKMGKKGDKDDNSARARTIAYKNSSHTKPSPIPLENCPWCGAKFTPDSFQLFPNLDLPTDLRIICCPEKRKDGKPKPACAFRRNNTLPIVAVDDSIYRRLPCFLIATVDKFANLPWVGETGALFGRVVAQNNEGFYGPAEAHKGHPLNEYLLPPELIIQDELHLISGPLGTMVGLYETAIDYLCSRSDRDKPIRPKIVASTATVRRATSQIRALFGRTSVEVFPPPVPDRRDSFFAKTVPVEEQNGRTYVGIAAQGRSLKVVLLRSYLALLGAAQKAWQASGGAKNPKNPADPYMTLLGYFNSLRELGGSRRIVEDEVRSRLEAYGSRKRENESQGCFADRTISDEPLELTSRISTNEVAEAKSLMEKTFHPKEKVDVVLATRNVSTRMRQRRARN